MYGDAGAFQVSRSLRFDPSSGSYLSKSWASNGSETTWTWSGWVKNCSYGDLFANSASGSKYFQLVYQSGGSLEFYGRNSSSVAAYIISSSVYRDPSAWMHVVAVVDTTNATQSDRLRLYVNNVRLTNFSSSVLPSPSFDFSGMTTANTALIGYRTVYFNGYLANIHFIDGQALTPSSFTETDATTGQLIPKTYTGSYGTNGFYLQFADNSSNTASTLGKDTSGNSNNWTPNNFSVSSGAPTSVAAATGALPVFNTTDTYGTVKGTGTRTDANSASIVLALPMDGTNGGTSFGDQSAIIKGSGSAKTVTVNGNSNTSTAQSKFYGSSGLFDGTGDFLDITPTTDFALPGDFTIEAWMYSALSNNNAIFSIGSYTSGLYFRTGESGDLSKITIYINNSQVALSASGAIKASQWTHVAVVRSGSTISIYVNGVSVVSGTSSYSIPAATTYVGRAVHTTGEDFNGYLQDVRVYKGVAKYTGNFNPPSSTANPTIAAGNDSLVDSPTNYGTDTGVGGEVRGNYCTWNPLDANSSLTLSNGSLDASNTASTHRNVRATFAYPATGKWYYEVTITGGNAQQGPGIAAANKTLTDQSTGTYVIYTENGNFEKNGVQTGGQASYGNGDIIGIAYNCDTNTLTFYKNNTSQGSVTPSTGYQYFPYAMTYNTTFSVNFGQRAFAYTAPSGFKALCTQNLPAPLVTKSNTVMDAVLYTGNGSTQSISSLNFSPDFLWFKSRSSTNDHVLFDAVRGRAAGMRSNGTDAEYTSSAGNDLASFDSAGFTVGAPQNWSSPNGNGLSVVAWAWDAGTSTVSNTQGSITSQVRANATAGFSVATWTGTGSGSATVGHGLGVAPRFFIVKDRSNARNWLVYHTSIGPTGGIQLNLTTQAGFDGNYWNNTAPTSTVATIGTYGNESANYVGYFFSSVVGYSSFGSYTGNGSSDGPFIYTGFRPKFFMIKRSDAGGEYWQTLDSVRDTYNVASHYLSPNYSGAEGSVALADFLSNGVKIRYNTADFNSSGGTYIYAAFAESPFNYSRAR